MSLELSDIQIDINGSILFERFSLTVNPGEIVSLMGPSGCGKSSLLSYLCGALNPVLSGQGRILVNGRDVTPLSMEKRRIGLLFQEDLLFPHMSVEENLAFALPHGLSRRERQNRIDKALASAGLPGYHRMSPDTLSGGQKARISLMRSLLAEPDVLLLDEPFSRLDAHLREQIRDFVFTTVKEKQIPALLVTHDSQDCDNRVVHLQLPQGAAVINAG